MGVADLKLRRAVFLDRDGVLNRAIIRDGKPYAPKNVSELDILPGVDEACAALRKAGFLLIVVTNQPDVARGTLSRDDAAAVNRALSDRLPVDDVRVCYHDDSDRCSCRKPKHGLLLDATRDWHVDLSASYMVGDRWKDIEAGESAGCKTVFIDAGYSERKPNDPDYCVDSLVEAVDRILQPRPRTEERTEKRILP